MLDISVVIPAKDRARTLPECLHSVLAQTVPPAEVVVVDDGSTDDTAEVLAAFAARGVRHERLPQGRGAQAARNWGVRCASNEWIAFQDSDDTWLPRKLELQTAALRAAGGGLLTVVHGDGLKRDESRGVTEHFRVPPTEGDCLALLLQRPGPLFPTLLTSRTALARCGGLDEDCPSYQEWDTAIRLARHCRFVHVREPLFTWVWHASDTISKDTRRALQGYRYVVERHRADILARNGPRAWLRLKLKGAEAALTGGLWEQAQELLADEPGGPAIALARACASWRVAPRGLGRLLMALS